LTTPFRGQTRVADLDLWTHLETKLADQLQVLREAIVENHTGRRDGVLAAGPLEIEIAELDLDFFRVGNSGISGYEWAVGPG
jgi:hypothetical protein